MGAKTLDDFDPVTRLRVLKQMHEIASLEAQEALEKIKKTEQEIRQELEHRDEVKEGE